MLTSLVKRAPF